jgi:hypothetical protein
MQLLSKNYDVTQMYNQLHFFGHCGALCSEMKREKDEALGDVH